MHKIWVRVLVALPNAFDLQRRLINPFIIRSTKTMAKITIGGVTLEGPTHEIAQIAKSMGTTLAPDKYYNSDSRGMLLITEMQTAHIRNAMLKMYRAWTEDLSGLKGIHLVGALRNGNDNPTFLALLTEYVKRVARGDE